jgi:site-specific recombinase XerD
MEQLEIPEFNPYFESILQRYTAAVSTTVTQSTVISQLSSVKNLFRYLTENHPEIDNLSKLKRSPHIEGWLYNLTSKKHSKATIRLRIMTVRKFLHNMYDWEWEDAPQPGLLTSKDMPPLDKYLPRPLTPESDMKLQQYLRKKNTLIAQALLLLRKTGLRIGELQNLELNCLEKISDGNYVLHVPLGKLHSERIIPVDSETVKIIKHITDLRPLSLFNPKTSKGTPYLIVNKYWRRPSYAGLRDSLANMAIQSGIQTPVSPHMLRHTYATELLRAGINLAALMKLMGHKDISMTLRYTGITQPDIQKAYITAIESSRSLYSLLKIFTQGHFG